MPFLSPADLPYPEIEPKSPASQADALTSEPPGEPNGVRVNVNTSGVAKGIGPSCHVLFLIDMNERKFVAGVSDWVSESFPEEMAPEMSIGGVNGNQPVKVERVRGGEEKERVFQTEEPQGQRPGIQRK